MDPEDVLFVPRTETYSSQQADQFHQLRTDSQWTDVTIHSQGTTFQCHRVILAASSPVLKAMMLADMAESKERMISLDDIPPSVLEPLINYMYMGEGYFPNDQLFSVTNAAEYLQLTDLKEYCLRHAVFVLAPSNVISWHKLADKLSANELNIKCAEMLAYSFHVVCKESEFHELSFAEMSSYMSDATNIEIDCDDLLEATLDWVQHKADSRQNHLMDLIQKINLSRCSIQCLDEVVDRHATLLDSQPGVLNVLTNAKQTSVKTTRSEKTRTTTTIAAAGGHDEIYPNCTGNKTFWYRDPSNQFDNLREIDECAPWLSVCETPDGFVVTGGEDSVQCMMYVSSKRLWKKLKCLTLPRDCHGSVFRNGRIYILGGLVLGKKSVSVQSLDLSGGEWCDEPDLPDPLEGPQVACMDGCMFLLEIDSGELLRLDMDSRSWKEESRRPRGMCDGVRMVAAHGQLMILGGDNRVFDCYDPCTQNWTSRQPPTLKHYYSAVVLHDEKLYLIGGYQEDRVEEYNFYSDSWSVCDYRVPKKLTNLYGVVLTI